MKWPVVATVIAAAIAVPALTQEVPPKEAFPKVAPENMRWAAPALADYTDEVLFGQVWRQGDLSPRDRSLVTLSALVAGGHTAQMTNHLSRALDNGVKPTEIGGLVTHLAFYTGWPNSVSALGETRKVLEARGITAEQMQMPSLAEIESGRMQVIRQGSGTVTTGAASDFTGAVQVSAPFHGSGGARTRGATVRFAAGARSAWHSHAMGQALVITEGCGWTQRKGGSVEKVCTGDVVMIAPGEAHWHGATASAPMTHVALSESTGVEWLEHVSEAEYAKGPR
jgi:4-carboxymuconolactone decarboxylase